MQTQKLDLRKTYGVVYGHDSAAFMQDGKLFDGGGNLVADEPTAGGSGIDDDLLTETESESIKFLRSTLAGGPMLQSTVKKLSEEMGLNWSDVCSAGADIKISKFKAPNGASNMWKLGAE